MAVRDDFAAGEVLAAADLNDTFASKADYPSGGTDGQALVKDGTSTAWANAGGLVLLSSESFSAVSAVSLNGVFSSNYDNYRLVISITASSVDAYQVIRWRASGSDDSGSNYSYQDLNANGTSVAASRAASQTRARYGYHDAGDPGSFAVIDVFRPFLSANTYYMSDASYRTNGATNIGYFKFVHRHGLTTSYDGLSLLPESGTITGVIRIYGYQNS